MGKNKNSSNSESSSDVVVSEHTKSMLSNADEILDESTHEDDIQKPSDDGSQTPPQDDVPQIPDLGAIPGAGDIPGQQQLQPGQQQIPQQPQQQVNPATFDEAVKAYGLDKVNLNDPVAVAKAYSELRTAYSQKSQDLTALNNMLLSNPAMQAPMGVNPAIDQQQVPTVPYQAPQQPYYTQQNQMVPQQPQPQQFQQQPPAQAQQQMSAGDVEKLNEKYIDDPVGVINSLLSQSGFMTKNDYVNERQSYEQQQQQVAQQQVQQEQYETNRVNGIISTLPDYQRYRNTMNVLYQRNPNYRLMDAAQSLPMLYNAAVQLTNQSQAGQQQPQQQLPQQQQFNQQFPQQVTQPHNPAQMQQNIAFANTNSGGGPTGGINPDGSDLSNVNWNKMSIAQLEKNLGFVERF